ncbi:MAG: serine/threonine protein kinase [Planctomycetes bacterium]|nr:serine/threonine protein kinase [Planctomycetota bacterium]
MSSADLPDADALWDAWCAARAASPELSPGEFSVRFGAAAAEAEARLLALCALEDEAPLPSLVRVLRPGADGALRFAGFRLLDELGEGAAGIVFTAIDERDGARVALKLLNPVLGGGRSQRDAILREARITAALDHPGIVRVLSSGVEQGYAWIATELIEGRSLARVIDGDEPAPARVALAFDVGLQVCGALAHAHARGVLHRDLKPANVMLAADGRAKVLDFGLAHSAAAAFGVSRSGEAVGTPLYMAPEQLAAARDLDERADLYALGLVLLELASGRRLIVREEVVRVLARIARGSGRFPRSFYEGVPDGLAHVLSRCLEPDRRDRYTSAAALAQDLERVRAGAAPQLGPVRRWTRLRRSVARRPWRSAAYVAVAGLLAWGGLAGWWLQRVSVSLATTLSRPPQAYLDAREIPAVFPYSTELRVGAHELAVVDQGRRYAARFEVRAEDARDFWFPFGALAGWPALPGPEAGPTGDVVAWQLTVRDAQPVLGAPELAVQARCDGWFDQVLQGPQSFLARVDGVQRVLRLAAPGYRPRELSLRFDDGVTRALDVVLDREDSPWHTLVVGSPLDPLLQARGVALDNLALRYEPSGAAHRFGYGVVDPAREGRLRFTLELPVSRVQAFELLDVADPLMLNGRHPGQGLLLSMGPSEDTLTPVFHWYWPGDEARGLGGELDPRDVAAVEEVFRAHPSRELHVEYRVRGEAPWALRTNAVPAEREDGSVRWDPALVLRVSDEPVARAPRHVAVEAEPLPEAARVVDLGATDALRTFAPDGSGLLVPFAGSLAPAAVRTGRDLSGDGVDDYVVRLGEEDALHLLDGRTGAELRVLSGDPGDEFGGRFDLVPDLDGDGCAEVLVGARQQSRGGGARGYVRLVSGGTGATLGERTGTLREQQYGHALSYVGELPVAGGHAALVSTFEYPIGGRGLAELLTLPGLDVVRTWKGADTDDHLGNTCAGLGDVDGDGVPDFAVAAYNEDRPYWDSGVARVYSGANARLLYELPGDRAWAWLGGSLLALDDVDGDGCADWLASQEFRGDELRGMHQLVVSGATGRVLRTFLLPGRASDPTPVGDLDGDGVGEVALYGITDRGDLAELSHMWVVSPGTGEVLLEVRAAKSVLSAAAITWGGPGRALVIGTRLISDGAAPALVLLLMP